MGGVYKLTHRTLQKKSVNISPTHPCEFGCGFGCEFCHGFSWSLEPSKTGHKGPEKFAPKFAQEFALKFAPPRGKIRTGFALQDAGANINWSANDLWIGPFVGMMRLRIRFWPPPLSPEFPSKDFCLRPCLERKTKENLVGAKTARTVLSRFSRPYKDSLLPPRLKWKIGRRWGWGSNGIQIVVGRLLKSCTG